MKIVDVIDIAPEVIKSLPTIPPPKHGGPNIEARRKLPIPERLTPKQMSFVEALIANGGNITDAAKAAGCSEASAHSVGWRWMQHPLVTEEVTRRAIALVAATAPASVQKLMSLRDHAKSQFVQLEASKDLLDRAGIGEIKRDVTAALVVNIKL